MPQTPLPSSDVLHAYDKIASWFEDHRSRDLFEKAWLDKALALLPPKGRILDIGCGIGQPMIPYFIERGFEVVGVDGSSCMLEKAKSQGLPATFIQADMRGLNLSQTFDMVLAWHSFFHLTRDDQRAMFPIFLKHLKQGGILLFTSGPQEGEVWSNNGGEMLYHASLDPKEYQDLLKQHGFTLLHHALSDPTCGDATIWLAKRED